MKKDVLLLFVIMTLGCAACNNDFTMNAPAKDVYVLNCILRSDSPIQYARVTKNLFTDNGGVPASDISAPFVKGAVIRLMIGDSVFLMRDTTILVTQSGTSSQVECYYIRDLTLLPGKSVRIEARMPDGTLLTSSSQTPIIQYSKQSWNFPQLLYNGYLTTSIYSWIWMVNGVASEYVYSIPHLRVSYKQDGNGTPIEKTVDVPVQIFSNGINSGQQTQEAVLSFNTYCLTQLETIHKTMKDISGDDPAKHNYAITKVTLTVTSLDPMLTKYSYIYNTSAEEFTIKLRQPEASNIEGGKGVFGITCVYSHPLDVDTAYVRAFGYTYNSISRP
ncbi:MAG TPA: DUF4249 family protein [Bacteroidota bacterium]|nr:DUF4249 family protein [Bacteroidota bacterium]